jgi:putative ABC transport system substrate-binding protein
MTASSRNLMIDRRAFLAGSLAVFAAPLAAWAQQAGKVHRIGFLFAGTIAQRPQVEGFFGTLRELGYIEGRNIVIERREAKGQIDQLPLLAEELVGLKPDAIVAVTTPAVRAAKKATQTIPIVMIVVHDPVRLGLVESLARPEANVTGPSLNSVDPAGKRLQLLKEILPNLSRIAMFWNARNPQNIPATQATEQAAKSLGLSVDPFGFDGRDNLLDTLTKAVSNRVGALVVVSDAVTFDHRAQIIRFSTERRLPSVHVFPEEAQEGGLFAYGASLREEYRRAASYVDKILKGAKPTNLPVEQTTKFDFVINLKTAKALGLTIPPSLLLRADQLIE